MAIRRYSLLVGFLSLLLFWGALYGVATGSVTLSASEFMAALMGKDITTGVIVFQMRIPRVLTAIAIGAALSISGAGFQGFFRNSLADPYVIGASSGAALGAAIALVAEWPNLGPVSAPAFSAFVGALAATALAFLVSRTAGDPPPAAALLLSGTALSSLFSALLSLVLVLKDRDLHRVYYWLLGGLGGASWTDLATTAPVMAVGCILVYSASRPLDLMMQGDDTAESLGLNIQRARVVVAAGASMATAAAVASVGIIGFVGLVAPHAVRMATGPGHRRLIPAAALGGACLVLAADIIARTAISPLELPIGIVTSAVGAPFFLYLLSRHGRYLGAS